MSFPNNEFIRIEWYNAGTIDDVLSAYGGTYYYGVGWSSSKNVSITWHT
jgi:hypothetical protein